jgi:ectoine hydroxylase-related dioxygenase (phytanoyl-CoA dioxygenase family)
MLDVDLDHLDEQLPDLLNELLTGSGAIRIRQAFSGEDIAEARRLIHHFSDVEGDKETHFQGANVERLHLQRRVWNLLNKGEVFERMVQHPAVVRIVGRFLGNAFIMGSVAANRLLPGGPGQEPHIDYPYWDMYKRDEFPFQMNSSFPLNAQATILLDPFTAESGATAFLPGSQRVLSYPGEDDRDRFHREAQRMIGDPGDCVIFNGMCWHCAMPNTSDTIDRTGVLIEYLPKFIAPLEDLRRGVRRDVVDRATPLLRQLMGLDYPYPEILDDNQGGVTIGRDTDAASHSALDPS